MNSKNVIRMGVVAFSLLPTAGCFMELVEIAQDAEVKTLAVLGYYEECMKTPGAICTVAGYYRGLPSGDAGTSVPLSWVNSVAYDADGNLYVGDGYQRIIVRVDKNTGKAYRVVGDGSARLATEGALAINSGLPTIGRNLAFDSQGNLYIPANAAGIIYKVDKTTGVISRFAGVGHDESAALTCATPAADGTAKLAADLCHPYAIAFDSQDNMYIAEDRAHRVLQVRASDGNVYRYAGAGGGGNCDGTAAALVQFPWNITVDGNDNVYVSSYNSRICRIAKGGSHPTPTYIASTFVGTGASGNGGDGGAATSAQVANAAPFAIERGTSPAKAYVVSGRKVRQLTLGTGIIDFLVGIGPGAPVYAEPNGTDLTTVALETLVTGVTVDDNGKPVVAGMRTVYRVEPSTGYGYRLLGVKPGTQVGSETRDVYVAILGGAAYSNIAWDSGKILYGGQYKGAHHLVSFDVESGEQRVLVGTGTNGMNGDGAGTSTQVNAVYSPVVYNGAYYFVDSSNCAVRKYSPSTGNVTTVAGVLGDCGAAAGNGGPATSAKLYYPETLDVDPATGELYVSNGTAIRKFTEGGNIEAVYSQGCCMDGLRLMGSHLYFFNRTDGYIKRVSTAGGAAANYAGNGSLGYSGDNGPLLSASFETGALFVHKGVLYVTSPSSRGMIRKLDATQNKVIPLAGKLGESGFVADGTVMGVGTRLPSSGPVVVDPNTGDVYMTDPATGVIRVWNKGLANQ